MQRGQSDSIQLCPVKGTEAKGTDWNKRFLRNIREHFCHHESDQALVQVTQRGCGVSIPGDSQKPPGYGPEQPTLRWFSLSRGLDNVASQGPFHLRPFCGCDFLFFSRTGVSGNTWENLTLLWLKRAIAKPPMCQLSLLTSHGPVQLANQYWVFFVGWGSVVIQQ